MNQAQLDLLTSEMSNMLQQYTGGMLTIVDVLNKAVDMRTKIGDTSLCGLTDPTTGLEYPTQEECDALDARNKARNLEYTNQWGASEDNVNADDDAPEPNLEDEDDEVEADDDGNDDEDDYIGPSDDEIEAMQAREQRESSGLSPKQMDDAIDRAGL